jgi:hypothetical protein
MLPFFSMATFSEIGYHSNQHRISGILHKFQNYATSATGAAHRSYFLNIFRYGESHGHVTFEVKGQRPVEK